MPLRGRDPRTPHGALSARGPSHLPDSAMQRHRTRAGRLVTVGLAACVLAACSSGTPPTTSAATVPAASVAATGVPRGTRAVGPQQLSSYWVMTNTSLTVDVPNSGLGLDRPTCSAVTYVIGSDGATRHIRVRETIPAGDLASVAASAVSDMRYGPGPGNAARQPVFTYLIVPFNLPKNPAKRKQITDACILKDFPQAYR